MTIPKSEIVEFTRSIYSHPEYLQPQYVIDAYRKYGFRPISDPFCKSIVTAIYQALSSGKPLSIVRVGDGEINLLSFGSYPNTPRLNQSAVVKIIAMQKDRFKIDAFWSLLLRDLMFNALLQADIIGVIGLWRAKESTPEQVEQRFLKDPRGISGHWRAVDYMLKLAKQGTFKDKTLAPAHLYFSILENLHDILSFTDKVFIISDRVKLIEKLKKKYPSVSFEYLSVGNSSDIPLPDRPEFLFSFYSALPQDMSGSLSLIGAGPWAEIYCAWIKQRGGVAVDIGSGFDLLDGLSTRPIHKILDKTILKKYSLE